MEEVMEGGVAEESSTQRGMANRLLRYRVVNSYRDASLKKKRKRKMLGGWKGGCLFIDPSLTRVVPGQ